MRFFRPSRGVTLSVILGLSSALLSSGCNRKTTSSPSAQPSQGQGHPALQFEYKKTSELLIAKSDPITGDRWTARIRRDGAPSQENEELWTIEMGPDEIAAGDRKAHGSFILHLLDTVRTLQVQEATVSGSPESFGLAPPLFVLRWRVSENRTGESQSSTGPAGTIQARVFKEYELRLGSPIKGTDGSFQGLYASFGGVPGKVFIVRGAMLQMLDRVTQFQSLRLPTVLTISSDDIDEVELRRSAARAKGKPDFYSQREGDQWTDAQHRTVKADVNAFLELTTHLRVLRFIDDVKEIQKVEPLITRSSTQTVIFKDRKGVATTLKIAAASGGEKVYATFSTRKRQTSSKKESLAVFEVYPEILEGLKRL